MLLPLARKISPALRVGSLDAPYLFSPLITASQIINVSLPGSEPGLLEAKEDMTLFDDALCKGGRLHKHHAVRTLALTVLPETIRQGALMCVRQVDSYTAASNRRVVWCYKNTCICVCCRLVSTSLMYWYNCTVHVLCYAADCCACT